MEAGGEQGGRLERPRAREDRRGAPALARGGRAARRAPGVLALAAVLACGACGGDRSGGSGDGEHALENVLLVTFDTTRADRLGCTGGVNAHTPVLDALAARGVLFERCIAAAPITLPSHATILTGLQPYHHGARNNGTHHLPPEVPTIAETLARAGFATGAVVAAIVLDSRFGLDQGFDHYDDDLSSAAAVETFVYRNVSATDVADRAIRWLDARGEERWFLWVHFFDPHADYAPPPEHAARCKGSAYDGEIAYADAELGRILERVRARGELEHTLVAMTADHGESLGEHGEQTHSLFVYDATTRVPLIFAHPSLARGKRVPEVVGSADIVPTLLELLDLAAPARLDGRSLARVLREPDARPEPVPAYSEAMAPLFNHGWSDLRALRDERVRYVRAPRPELYDLAADPGEVANLLPGAEERAADSRAALDALLPDDEANAQGSDAASLDPELARSLDALGYGGSGESGTIEDAAGRPDPKDKIGAWEQTLAGWGMVRAGMHERSLDVFRAVIADDPGSVNARQGLATALRELGRHEDALRELEELVALPAAGARSFVLLAEMQHELGRGDWRASLARARALDPRDTMPWTREGDWSLESGDVEAAEHAYREAIALDEREGGAWVGLAAIEHGGGRADEAAALLRRALEVDPLSFDAHYNLGAHYERASALDDALAHYEHAARIDPRRADVRAKVGELHLRAGRLDRARAALEAAIELEPESFVARFHLGQIDFQEGDFAAAAEHFARACAADPSQPEAWRRRMMACRALEDSAGTLEAAERLLELLPDDVQGCMTSAVALAAQGRHDEADARVARALELDAGRVAARARQDPELAALLARHQQR